ncbi:MAG: alpha/beta hydrolase [Promethearchaeota archaeon]
MQAETFFFSDEDGVEIFVYKWLPEADVPIKGVVQIAHGAASHAGRYAHVGESFVKAGYVVYANDHRGHGKTGQKSGRLGILSMGDWERMVRNLKELTDIAKGAYTDSPFFILGHSMGSFLVQNYIQMWGSDLQGALLTGTTGEIVAPSDQFDLESIQRSIAEKGFDAREEDFSNFMKAYNEPFEPARTEFDWLTRDQEAIQRYIDDPLCGFPLSYGFIVELGRSMFSLWDSEKLQKIPKDLPIYIFVGSMDPVSGMAKGAKTLLQRYQDLGIKDVTLKEYPDCRHELFNEINREEVIQDVIAWLNAHL